MSWRLRSQTLSVNLSIKIEKASQRQAGLFCALNEERGGEKVKEERKGGIMIVVVKESCINATNGL